MHPRQHESELRRRDFLRRTVLGAGALTLGLGLPLVPGRGGRPLLAEEEALPAYEGPNVIIVRFGGGVRRQETVGQRADCWSPYFRDVLAPRGTLFPNMELSESSETETSHGQGTLNILTGRYDGYEDVNDRFLGERFAAKVPTLFEYLRKSFAVPEHQTLIVNGEDRTDEEFYSFSNHHEFGVQYRSRTISLYRFKLHLLRRQIAEGKLSEAEIQVKQQELAKLESIDLRTKGTEANNPEIERLWEGWRQSYGDSGFRNARGDRLLTELTLRAMRDLQPRLVMVNYQDPDYVHWGNANHYHWGIQIIDEGLQRLTEAVASNEAYRDNTIFCIVPDCGRDDNRFTALPFQHHFNSRPAREIFALLWGPGVDRGQVVDRTVDQVQVAGTVARLMGVEAAHAEGQVLEEAFA